VENISDASTNYTLEHGSKLRDFSYTTILSGLRASDCLLPCLRTTTTVEEGLVSSTNLNLSVFALGFSNTVSIKRTSMDRFNFNDFLNFLGSNLGLWPGLGLFQVLEWTFTFITGTQYCVILYCTVLYFTALYCTALYCTVLYCTVRYCTILYCTILYCTVLYCTVLYCTVLYCAVLCCTVLYCTVLCCTVLYCTVLYCTVYYQMTNNW